MAGTSQETVVSVSPEEAIKVYRKKVFLSFTIFLIFFVYYIGTAIIQTPQMKDIASILVAGLPLGLLLSLGVFPVSWILILIYFRLGR